MTALTVPQLEEKAKEIRKKVIQMIYCAGSGHPGGSLSSADIFTALFLGGTLKLDQKDRFILSCGHYAPVYYAVLAEKGYFNEDILNSLRELDSPLQGHPSKKHAEFIETSSGSLGQGLSVGIGKALALKLEESKAKVVVLSSDGEQNEGSQWEAVMFAAHHRLDNLNLIVDQNGMQIGGRTKKVLDLEPLAEKYRAFGWEVSQTDGHDFKKILPAFSSFEMRNGKPKVIICQTIRGKGVSFMEGNAKYHACKLTEEEYERAMEELENSYSSSY